MKSWACLFSALIVILIIFIPMSGYCLENADCLECHEETINETIKTYDNALTSSIHGEHDCLDCHVTITDLPHDEKLPSADCGQCHEEAAEIYTQHGRISLEAGYDIPHCFDCHGKHDILEITDRGSRVNPINLPRTCGNCHENADLTKRHELLYGKAVAVYKSSVHGKASLGGVYVAATCNDCHSTGGTAHRIFGPGHPESSINHFNIPRTCGKCHQNIENDFWEGIHGKLVSRGETDSPVCTDCHGEHGIMAPSDPDSRVSASRVAEATCSPCHESARLNEKYGFASSRLQTWIDSYHGLKSKAGDLTVANCSSCHGAHRILPHTDSTSSIYAHNLQSTCGVCHPGISAELAATPIHGAPGISRTPVAGVIRQIYIIAIAVIIGLMVIHWLIDLRKKIKMVMAKEQIVRMKLNEVWQHLFLMLSFTTLVVTGFALRYYDSWWANFIFSWEGAFPMRGLIHRVAAVIFVLVVIWHLIYLTTRRGKQYLKDMKPTFKDAFDFIKMIKYNLGIAKEKPVIFRFGYEEKAEYWALVWGTAIMIFSGFFLWFDDFAVSLFPKGFLDVMLVIHYYEAWLAMLAILIWHMYSTVFNPHIYPMNPAWLTGKMPVEWYKQEHPGDPALTEKPDGEISDKKIGNDKHQN
jgi:cytochrome b subunit of formate dehydrogenase